MENFNGKVCVITGAGSGIGRGLALALAGRGARLALSDIKSETVAETVEQCLRGGAPEAEAYTFDVADRSAVEGHAAAVAERFGRVNLVVNNAGVALAKDVIDTPIEDYEWIMGINFWGVVYGSKAFLPHLIASGDGHVVNISSVFGIFAVPGQSGYNAAKFAVRGFTEALRAELEGDVGVTVVHPGGIRTRIAETARVAAAVTAAERAAGKDSFARMLTYPPERAAEQIVAAVEGRRPRLLIGLSARVPDVLARVAPTRYPALLKMVQVGHSRLGRRTPG
jgi:hypothetical protein